MRTGPAPVVCGQELLAMQCGPDPPNLETVPLFRSLSPAELAHLAGLLHHRTFGPHRLVLLSEQLGEAVYIILSGFVQVVIEHPEGLDVILAVLGKGEILGEMSVVDHLARSATARTISEATLAWLPRRDFWECLRSMPALTYNLASILSRRLRLSNEHIQAVMTLDLPGRVAWHLLTLLAEHGEQLPDGARRLPFPLTQGDLASLVGASRFRVNRVLSEYRTCGYLTSDRQHRITVLDPPGLARHCG
jgi:CRP-like cAMP-binding protein